MKIVSPAEGITLLLARFAQLGREMERERDRIRKTRIGEDKKCSVIIEDGSVKDVEAPKKAKKVKATP